MITAKRLGVGFVGGGSDTRLHLRSLTGVRDADVRGVWSPHGDEAVAAAKPYRSVTAMVADAAIDALWLCGPAGARLEIMEEIADAVIRAKGKLVGVASDAPLAQNVADAERVTALAAHAGLKHGYLEPRVFAPAIVSDKRELWTGAAASGRPHLARARQAYPGPQGPALLDGLCHSVLVTRFLLTEPGAFLTTLRPQHVTSELAAHSILVTIEFATVDGKRVCGEASASWGVGEVDLMAGADGYTALNQHVVRAFLGSDEALLTFQDGLDVMRLLTAAQQSLVEGRAIAYAP